jgi:molecular chaperone GrpE
MKDAVDAVEARERDGDGGGQPKPPQKPQQATPPSDDPASAAQALLGAQKELEAALAKAKQDTADLKDKWLRAAAELENYKKRTLREREDAVKFGNERLLRDLLPVLDDLDRTVEATSTAGSESMATLIDGLKMVQKKFIAQLEKNGVELFASVGQPFDPQVHEAVQQVHSNTAPAGAVAHEIRRGFNLNGRLLRPALVAVSLGPKTE